MCTVIFPLAAHLNHLAQSLHLDSLSDLCQFLSTLSPEHHLQWSEMVPSEMEWYNIEMFGKFLGKRVPLNIYPLPPNCNATLIHWRPLYALLCHLPDLWLKDFEQITNSLGQPLSYIPSTHKSLPAVADAHVHLDKLLKDTGHPAPVAGLKAMSCCITPNVNLEIFIANFSFLSQNNMHWSQSPEEITDPLSRLAYSIHPKTAGELTDAKVSPLMLQLE